MARGAAQGKAAGGCGHSWTLLSFPTLPQTVHDIHMGGLAEISFLIPSSYTSPKSPGLGLKQRKPAITGHHKKAHLSPLRGGYFTNTMSLRDNSEDGDSDMGGHQHLSSSSSDGQGQKGQVQQGLGSRDKGEVYHCEVKSTNSDENLSAGSCGDGSSTTCLSCWKGVPQES